MRKRKVLSSVVLSALIAAQMSMSVMAGSGTTTVDVTTKNAVIRVEVPTKVEVAVDELATVGDGSQIASEEFYIKNKSTVPVYVKTESVVTANTSTAVLKATKAEVVPNTADAAKGNAWLAVAAQTEAGKYGSGTIGDLTETSANVATVDAASGKAAQEFYLAKSSSSTIEYEVLDAAAKPAALPTYAEYYKLTELAADSAGLAGATENDSVFNAATADSGATVKNNDILKGLLATKDVYVDNGSAVSKLTSADADTATYSASNTYYTADATAADFSSAATGKYVYAGADAEGGKTAFRFIGKLSTGKTGGWTKSDFTNIVINYDITGVQASAYEEAVKSCTYGLYKEVTVTGPQVSLSTDGVITLTNLDGTEYSGLVIDDGEDEYVVNDWEGEWSWDDDDADTVKTFTLGSGWMDPSFISGKTVTVTLNLTDGSSVTSAAVTFPAA